METILNTAPPKIKHPKEMYSLALVVSLERFAYYGTTALLLAYIVTQLHFNETAGYAVFGTFAALAYGLPLFCGVISDQILGKRKSLVWGCLLHVIGLGCVALPYHITFFIGLSTFVIGNGFFGGIYKALLGDFYAPDDHKGKDAAYTITYGLFNVGVATGAIICGYIGQQINWRLGFAVAALGALLSLISMLIGIKKHHGAPVDEVKIKKKILPGVTIETLVYLLTLPAITLLVLVFQFPKVMDLVLLPLSIVSFAYVIYLSFGYTKSERYKIFASLIAFMVWLLYLALYEQVSGSFNLFVLRNMDMHVGSILLPGLAINNFLPGFLPAIIMPLMLLIWKRLSKVGLEPGTMMKFIIGFLFIAAFFGSFWWGCKLYANTGMVPVYFMFGGYILLEISELCVGPIVYALAYKLAPKAIAGTMMGVLGLAAASGEYLASKIGSMATVPTNIISPVESLPYYTKIYGGIALLSLGVVVLLALLLPLMRKLMQDVD
jgi:POT family proton-dependent oligopeptide transporter